jgi:hypothetical protein
MELVQCHVIREMEIKEMKYPEHLLEVLKSRMWITPNVCENVEKQEFSLIVCGDKTLQGSLVVPYKIFLTHTQT